MSTQPKDNLCRRSGVAARLFELYDGRKSAFAVKTQTGYVTANELLSPSVIEGHLRGDQSIGVYLLKEGNDEVKFGVFDLDNHHGSLPFDEVVIFAKRIVENLKSKQGIDAKMIRSGGGDGVHIPVFLDDFVDASALRQLMKSVLAELGLKDGASGGGIADGYVEVFPKQDKVAVGKYGSLIALPLARKSVPLNSDGKPTEKKKYSQWLDEVPINSASLISNTEHKNEIPAARKSTSLGPKGTKCLFVEHCRNQPDKISEPLWHSLATNLAVMETGEAEFHEISQLDTERYDRDNTATKLARAKVESKPHRCVTIRDRGFDCPERGEDGRCNIHGARAPAAFDAAGKKAHIVDELNDKHAVVHIGNQTSVLRESTNPTHGGLEVGFESVESFRKWYSNRKIDGVNIASVWLDSENRRQYEGVVFDPGQDHADHYNLFQGFPIKPQKGKTQLFWDFVLEVICSNNQSHFEYLRLWLAHLFQLPAVLPEVAIVQRGLQGTGKNTFVNTIGRLLGQHFVELVQMSQVVGRFNLHLKDALFVHANEAVWGGDKQAVGAFKSMITDPHVAIEQKGKDILMLPNYKRLIVSSNEDWAVPRDLDDRRLFVLDVSDARKEDVKYFGKLRKSLDERGLAALMHDLVSMDIKNFNPRIMPKNNAGFDLKLRGADSTTKWWFESLRAGAIGKVVRSEGWPLEIPTKQLYRSYQNWCSERGERHTEIDSIFVKNLKKLVPLGKTKQVKESSGARIRKYVLPSLKEARKSFESVVKHNIDWDE